MVEYDLVIIGGGPAGLVIASAAAQLKAKVALVEKNRMGGDCLWYGCVPSKSLIQASRAASTVREATKYGVYGKIDQINFTEALGYVDRVIKTIEPHDSPERFRNLGVDVFFGQGHFSDRQTFILNNQQLTARKFVICTGSRPAIPEITGLKEVGYITNEQVFSLTSQPQSLAIIGGGAIACELGQALHRLGSQVTLLVRGSRLLRQEDAAVSQVMLEEFHQAGIKVIFNSKIDRVELINGKKVFSFNGQQITVDEILIAAGRQPNIETLGLENAEVKCSDRGIKVNHKLQTTNPKIYAAGDVIGGYQFTHVAGYEASIVIKNALFFPLSKVNYRVIPWAIFTEPEVARVGMLESDARTKYGDQIEVLYQDFAGVDRAQTEGKYSGFAKIIVNKKGEILGATIVGTNAGELIHEVVLAMSQNLKISALNSMIYIYPTLAEIISKASLQLTKKKYAKNQRLQNFLELLFQWRRKWNL